MGQRILADTNCLIDYLDNKLTTPANKLLDNEQIGISVINRIELLSWHLATPEQTQILIDFIHSCVVHPLHEEIILKSIQIRKNQRLKLPDAIIAATSLVHNLTLLTRNITDFNKVPGLKVINPHSL
jgi:predicted nucleic acid-binding protein